MYRKSHETLRPGDARPKSAGGRVRGSLEQQTKHLQAEAERKRHRPHHEVDELALREDLRSWRRPV
jgi:hypothetical protein